MLTTTTIISIIIFIMDVIVLSQPPFDYPSYESMPRPRRPGRRRYWKRVWSKQMRRQPPWNMPPPDFIPPPVGPPPIGAPPIGPPPPPPPPPPIDSPFPIMEPILVEEEIPAISFPPEPLFNSPQIQAVVNSLNSRTTAFSKPGQGYENVIAILKAYNERKSGTIYNPSALRITPTGVQNELSANEKVAGVFYETDIALTVSQASRILNRGRTKRKIVANMTMRWKSPVIPYRFAINDAEWKKQIQQVLAKFSKNTCLRFVENMAAEDYLLFNRGEGCYSPVGRLGGVQEISIGYGCEMEGVISHELGHALGLWHEQSRPDRENYVNVHLENVLPGTEGQFEKLSSVDSVDYGVPYDYGSVMHYASTTFTKSSNRKTITPRQPQYEHTIGNRGEASFLDFKILNKAYCSGICRNTLSCYHGGYAHPNACNRCICPTGLGGTYCETVQPSSCGTELPMATNEWKNISYSGSSNCYWRINTDPGCKIRFEFTYIFFKCSPICDEFVEVKFDLPFDRTGYRLCCRAEYGPQLSSGDSILVITKATVQSQFVLRYRRECATTTVRTPVTTVSSGIWMEWSSWSECSEKCGACGKRRRGRTCTRAVCYGSTFDVEVCNLEGCRPGTTIDGLKDNVKYGPSSTTSNWCCSGFKLSDSNICVPV